MQTADGGERSMLRVEGVVKSYDDRRVVDCVSLAIEPGEIVCLLGPSGCGKTTLLRIVAGLEQADQGRIICQGVDLAAVPVHKRNFGFMFQEFALFPHRSVGENIAFGLRMHGISAAAQKVRVGEMLALIGLPAGYATRSIFELSGGERQRVALARSLAPNPRLLMLDEPLGSLDRALRERLMLELRSILKQVGMTAIYVTHDQEEAYAVADRIAVMQAGRIVQTGSPQTLYTQPATPFVARFLGFDNLLPVEVTDSGRQLASPYGTFDLPPGSGRLLPGTQHILLIHPEAATLVAGEERALPNRLAARLRTLSFRGDHFEITAALRADASHSPGSRAPADAIPGTTSDSLAEAMELSFHMPTYAWLHSGRDAPTPGDRLWLQIESAKTSLLPSTAAAAAP